MERSQGFINLSSVVINNLQEGKTLGTYYLFHDVKEVKQLINVLNLFCKARLNYIEVSFYNNPELDTTIALRVLKVPFGYHKDLVTYLDNDVRGLLDKTEITLAPIELRRLVVDKFF